MSNIANSADSFPLLPNRIEETGLNIKFIGELLAKSVYRLGLETNDKMAAHLKLGQSVVDDLLSVLKQQGLIEVPETKDSDSLIGRFSLTTAGKNLAIEAFGQCAYIGPVPVPLKQYQAQVQRQSLSNEKVSIDDISACLSHLILPASVIRKLGPAINSGRSLLIYGAAGNGKTSIIEAIGKAFRQPVYIPHCIEVEGRIIRVFDPAVHSEMRDAEDTEGDYRSFLQKRPDPRWVQCRRPIVITGGALTLERLDLEYNEATKFYEAPLQMKAIGGVFIIDDFGRQQVQPRDLLNRWIIPLERQVDSLTMRTGRTFDVPLDELVIFSTNLSPQSLMDPGVMRRVKYKLRLDPPSMSDYVTIFRQVCSKHNIELSVEVLSYLLGDFYPRSRATFAAYHPAFIVEHALAACRYRGIEPQLTEDLVKDALDSLFVVDSEPPVPVTLPPSLAQEFPCSQTDFPFAENRLRGQAI